MVVLGHGGHLKLPRLLLRAQVTVLKDTDSGSNLFKVGGSSCSSVSGECGLCGKG